MKKALAGCHFASDDVIIAGEEFFKSQAKQLFYTAIKALQHRGSMSSTLEEGYVEKNMLINLKFLLVFLKLKTFHTLLV